MGTISSPEPVKLISGIIAASEELRQKALEALEREWGVIDLLSPVVPFSFTEYYEKEMGKELLRSWVSFKDLIDPGRLPEIKRRSNDMEQQFAAAGGRRVNLDPGYLALSKLVLASTKDFNHRVYLGSGIFAEVTMFYRHNQFEFLPWTYPDYRSEPALAFFGKVRAAYRTQRQAQGLL